MTYFMEHPDEGARLAAKVDAVDWARRYFASELATSKRILDVGCGPGHLTRVIALTAPHADVAGADVSESRIAAARKSCDGVLNARFDVANAEQLPYETNSFDLVICRFLLEYLPDPQRVTNEMFRVLAPGGRVILQDLDGQLLWHWPEQIEFIADLKLLVTSLSKSGFDPFVGRKLFGYARRSGFTAVEAAVEPYHMIIGRVDDTTLDLWMRKLTSASTAIAAIFGNRADAFVQSARSYLLDSETLTYSNMFSIRGSKPI